MQLESIPKCPLCNSEGSLLIKNLRDYICGVPGTWSFKKCHQCKSLWIDPRPTKEMIPSLYPRNYCFTHTEPQSPLKSPKGFAQQLKFAVKLGILEQAFGYQGLSHQTSLSWGIALGKLISWFPKMSKWAGYTVRFLSYRSQGHLLEVGTGNGSFLWLMDKLGWQVTGIEPDPQAAQAAAATGLKIIQCDIEQVELRASSYDAIVLHHVLEHLPNPKNTLTKLVNSLKPGGILVSISPNPIGFIANSFAENWYQLDPPRHLVLPSPEGYKSMFSKTSVVEVNVSTTMQTAFWMYKESLSLKQTGKPGLYQGWLVPKIFSWLNSMLLYIFPNSGEEVICIAVKN